MTDPLAAPDPNAVAPAGPVRAVAPSGTGGGPDPLAPYDAVLLLSYGGPDGPDDVLPFMRNATAGRGVPDSRLVEVSGHYQRFGGVSPINARNRELLVALRTELAGRGSAVPVGWGNRNWHPFVSEGLASLLEAAGPGQEVAPGSGCGRAGEVGALTARRVVALTTSAYASYSGCRQYREDLAGAVAAWAESAGAEGSGIDLTVDKTRPPFNTPGMLEANVEAIVTAYSRLAERGVPAREVRLVLVTHSIPMGMETGSAPSDAERVAAGSSAAGGHLVEPGVAADLSTEIGYVAQHEAFAAVLLPEVARRLDLPVVPDHDLVYCSRSGPPQARWLEPDVNDHLEALAGGQVRGRDGAPVPRPGGVVVAPVGFVSDHMEVVFDLDTEAAQTAADLDLPYERAATAGTHPAFVASLVDLLLERAAVARGEEVVPVSTTGTGPFHTVCPSTCCRPGTRPAHGGGHPGAHRSAPAHVSDTPDDASDTPDDASDTSDHASDTSDHQPHHP